MEAKDSFSLTWCAKHSNWWVTNCPDCMVDDNEQSIKREGMREVIEWIKWGRMSHNNEQFFRGTQYNTKHFMIPEKDWQARLEEWGVIK